MSDAQTAAGLAPKRRFRSKSLQVQLQQALLHAQSLEKLKPSDDSISRMKLAQMRITSLQWLIGRKDTAKTQALNKALEENKALKLEVERIQGELAAALGRQNDPVAAALAKHDARKGRE